MVTATLTSATLASVTVRCCSARALRCRCDTGGQAVTPTAASRSGGTGGGAGPPRPAASELCGFAQPTAAAVRQRSIGRGLCKGVLASRGSSVTVLSKVSGRKRLTKTGLKNGSAAPQNRVPALLRAPEKLELALRITECTGSKRKQPRRKRAARPQKTGRSPPFRRARPHPFPATHFAKHSISVSSSSVPHDTACHIAQSQSHLNDTGRGLCNVDEVQIQETQ